MYKIKSVNLVIMIFSVVVFSHSSVSLSAINADNSVPIVQYPTVVPDGTTFDEILPDEDLALCISRDLYGLKAEDVIPKVKSGYSLECENHNIYDLEGVNYFNSDLTYAVFSYNFIEDVSDFNVNGMDIYFDNNNIKNLPDSNYWGTYSHFDNNNITDISTLSDLEFNIMSGTTAVLSLSGNHIFDISVLTNFSNEFTLLAQLTDQTIDLGSVSKIIDAPIVGVDDVDFKYIFTMDENFNSSNNTIDLGNNYGESDVKFDGLYTTIDGDGFEVTSLYSGSITFDRIDLPPTITNPGDVTIEHGTLLDILENVTASDLEDGDLTSVIVTDNPDGFKGDGSDKPGEYTITYTVTDSFGNETTETRVVTVEDEKVITTPEEPQIPEEKPYADDPVVENDSKLENTGLSNITLYAFALIITLGLFLKNKKLVK